MSYISLVICVEAIDEMDLVLVLTDNNFALYLCICIKFQIISATIVGSRQTGCLIEMCLKMLLLEWLQDHTRLAVTRDIDTSMLTTAEFYFKYGCDGTPPDSGHYRGSASETVVITGGRERTTTPASSSSAWPRHHSVVFQYSSNGGITWNLLKEIHYPDPSSVRSGKKSILVSM